jgi:hypothetical protein
MSAIQHANCVTAVDDCDLERGTISITQARMLGREKDRTKTGEDRDIALCGRALDVLRRQMALRERLASVGRGRHEFVFFQEDGAPLINLSYPYDRWRYVMEQTGGRYREPYNARHSYISWRLMAGHNILLVAQEDGHSVHTMLTTYAAWTKGSTAADVETIKRAMLGSPMPSHVDTSPVGTLMSPRAGTTLAPEGGWGRLSWRKFKDLDWRSGQDSNATFSMESVTYCIQKRANPPSTPTIPEFRTRFRTTSETLSPAPTTQNPAGHATESRT